MGTSVGGMATSEDHLLVAVYPSRSTATAAARAARHAGATDVEVGSHDWDLASLLGEMRDETEHAAMGPGSVGPWPENVGKSILGNSMLYGIVGAILLLPFGLIPLGGLPTIARLGIAAGIGAFAGSVFGLTLGAGLGAPDPDEPMAAERGVTVGLHANTDREDAVRAALDSLDPIRVDEVDDVDPDQRRHRQATEPQNSPPRRDW